MYVTRKFLATGGNAFLGSHLTVPFLYEGVELLCVNKLFNYTPTALAHLMNNRSCELRQNEVIVPLFVEGKQVCYLALREKQIY
jgi:UDP-glucose 4-epimerase|tara:strand:+ start:105 stop:356 length:252 start_codon:yes stop_codon:yes gene_type:complete